jgi:transposase
MAWRGSPKGISTMPINFRTSDLAPVGLIVESITKLDDAILVTARAGIQVATCPLCGSLSRHVHSRYVREVSDLSCSGRSVRLRIVARRFCCSTPHCRRRIFAERFDKTVLLVRSRRTSRLDCVVHSSWIGPRRQAGSDFAKPGRMMSRRSFNYGERPRKPPNPA